MIPKVWLINLILALFVVFIGKSAYSVWTQEDRPNPEVRSEKKTRPAVERRQSKGPAPLMEASYEVIADQNLFSSDRAEYLPPETITEPELPKLPGKKINLYGVIIMDDTRRALIDNPVRKSGEPRNKWVTVGDTLGDLTVAAIEPESLLLKEGAKKYKIPLYTKKAESPSFSGPDTDRSTSSPTVVNTETKKQTSVPKVVSSGTGKKRGTPEADVKKEDEGTGETIIIDTPFGPVKRRKN